MKYTLIFNTKAFFSTKQQALQFFQQLADAPPNQRLIIAVPASLVLYAKDKIRGNPTIGLAIQDISGLGEGAFTGAENGLLLKDLGAQYALIGHPETRTSGAILEDEIVSKLNFSAKIGIHPILYVGNSFDQEGVSTLETISNNLISLNKSKVTEATIVLEHGELGEAFVRQAYQLIKKECSLKQFQFYCAGNVDAEKISTLKKLKFIDGFAIGHHALNENDRNLLYEQSNN
jgi:triosephosphate isomerase